MQLNKVNKENGFFGIDDEAKEWLERNMNIHINPLTKETIERKNRDLI